MADKKPRFTEADGGGIYFFAAIAIIFFFILVPLGAVWVVVFAAGAARLANQRHNSFIIAALAFVLSPLYYIYYAFTG